MKKALLFAFMVLFSAILFAEGKVTITESNKLKPLSLNGDVFFYIDSEKEYGFQDILAPEFSNKFTQSENPDLFFSAESGVVWIKLEIENNTEENYHGILGIDNSLIKNITFFSTLDSVFIYTGSSHIFSQRQIKNNSFLFNIFLQPKQSTVCCIKIDQQNAPMLVPISFKSQQLFFYSQNRKVGFSGVLRVFEILFILIAFLLWRTERNKSYLYLFIFITFFVIQNLWRQGFLFQYVWGNAPVFNESFGLFVNAFLLPLLLLFINNFLKVKKLNKTLGKVFKFLLLLSAVYAVSSPFIVLYSLNNIIFKTIVLLVILASIIGLVLARNKKYSLYVEFVVAISLIFIDLILKSFFNYNIIGYGMAHQSTASAIVLIFFMLGASVFIKKFQGSRIEVRELNKNLEQLVDKRTAQLNSQKEELRSQHEELILQKETLQTQREELRAQKELLEMKNVELEKLSLVASKTDNLIYIFNADGTLNWFNKSFESILGVTLEEYQYAEPYNIADVSTNKNIRHVLNTCLREKSVVSYESTIIDQNKHAKWYHTTLTPILDDRENIKHLIAIDTDITRLKEFEDELNQQKADAENQKNLAIKRKEELEDRQIEITDSIRYAKRIQTAIMPKIKQIHRDFNDSFVLFLPKDIVSGDFYWYHRIENKYFIAAVDCTGHGVPGAFMSIIGNYLLNSIIIHNNVNDPAEILKQLNRKIKIALKADNRTQTSDGMDISIAVVDKNNKTVEVASALRPFYLFSNGDFIEVKGDKIPITSNISGTTISTFKKHVFSFNEGDKFYMFSDGIIDQFGGKNGKKFLTKRFKQLLFEINPLTMREQKEIIKKAFDDWKGENEQVDDVLVMGIKFTEELRR